MSQDVISMLAAMPVSDVAVMQCLMCSDCTGSDGHDVVAGPSLRNYRGIQGVVVGVPPGIGVASGVPTTVVLLGVPGVPVVGVPPAGNVLLAASALVFGAPPRIQRVKISRAFCGSALVGGIGLTGCSRVLRSSRLRTRNIILIGSPGITLLGALSPVVIISW